MTQERTGDVGEFDGPELDALVEVIPEGWSRADIDGKAWGVTRTTRAGGKVVSVSGERLDGMEQLGANVWVIAEGTVLRPCEVPAQDVMRFLRGAAQSLRQE